MPKISNENQKKMILNLKFSNFTLCFASKAAASKALNHTVSAISHFLAKRSTTPETESLNAGGHDKNLYEFVFTGQTGRQDVKADWRNTYVHNRASKTVRLNETKWKRRYANSQIRKFMSDVAALSHFGRLTHARRNLHVEIYMGAKRMHSPTLIWLRVCVCVCTVNCRYFNCTPSSFPKIRKANWQCNLDLAKCLLVVKAFGPISFYPFLAKSVGGLAVDGSCNVVYWA